MMIIRERKHRLTLLLAVVLFLVLVLLYFFQSQNTRPADESNICQYPYTSSMRSVSSSTFNPIRSDLLSRRRATLFPTGTGSTRRPTPPVSASLSTLPPQPPVPDAWTQLVQLSRRTNELQKRAQQAQCNSGLHSTDTGAWCRLAVFSLHLTDPPLAAALAQLFTGKTVLSLGEGQGDYRRLVLNASSQVLRYDAYDGAPFTEESTKGVVRYLDLTLPQFWLPRYDWVLCLEVLEHIPKSYESVVLDNVIRPASEGIIISWASPYQPGYGHVNSRESEYVEQTMEGRGLSLDEQATMKLRRAATLMWFQNHISVYRVSPAP